MRIPERQSMQRFKDRVRQLTRRGLPLKTNDLIDKLGTARALGKEVAKGPFGQPGGSRGEQ